MVFGSVNRERIQLNEETLWMGGRRTTDNPEALAALPEVRRLLFADQPRDVFASHPAQAIVVRLTVDTRCATTPPAAFSIRVPRLRTCCASRG